MKLPRSVYMTRWGKFVIPDSIDLEMYDANQQSALSKILGLKHTPVPGIKPLPANPEFWKWLDEQEIAAGKPCKSVSEVE